MSAFRSRKVDHPNFRRAEAKGYAGFPVIIFDRDEWKTPSEEQCLDYQERKKKVEELGGVMYVLEWEVAGRNPPFTEEDCLAMRRAVEKTYPEWRVCETWNGSGYYTFSVSIGLKKRGSKP